MLIIPIRKSIWRTADARYQNPKTKDEADNPPVAGGPYRTAKRAGVTTRNWISDPNQNQAHE